MTDPTEGLKFDTGKPRVGLIFDDFADAIVAVAEVGTFGANKYSPGNWKYVDDGTNRYRDALGRHLMAYMKDPDSVDPESGKLHLAHAAWNAMAILQLYLDQPEEELSE